MQYQNGKIYKIISQQTDLIYVGSTIQKYLCSRLVTHKQCYNKWLKNDFHYITSYELIKYDDVKIVLIELYPCNSKDELRQREQYYLDNTLNIVNHQRAHGRKDRTEYLKNYNIKTKQQRHLKYEANKKEILGKQQEYRKINRDKIREKEKRIYNCECGSKLRISDKARHEKSIKHQNYINDIQIYNLNEIYICECGSKGNKKNISKHKKTKKHQNYLLSLNNNK